MLGTPSKRKTRGPIWARPAPGVRQPRFTRDQIAAAAIAIADEDGFPEVSMRRVAERIGAGTMTLYHYVRTKADLLALMEDALMAEWLVPAAEMPRDWRAAMTAIARRARDAMARHPWALHSMQGARMGPNVLRHVEQSMAAISEAPLPMEVRFELIAVVDDFVFGRALRAADSIDDPFADPRAVRALDKLVGDYLKTGEFPHIAAFVGAESPAQAFQRAGAAMNDERCFEFGIQAILDGAERRSQARGARSPAGRARR
jgi:AcrR family transcriptional regulator